VRPVWPVEDSGEIDEVVVITGMSGAGRTEAAKVLEDIGFYVIDNLPPTLVGKVVELAAQPGSSVERLAIVADVRGRAFFGELVDAIRQLRDRRRDVRVLFLDASDDTLVARFEANRRRHPMGEDPGVEGVLEGIERERGVLEELRGMADLVIDTSDLNVHELRDRLVDAFAPDEAMLRVNVVSFGYKYGLPRDADLVMDVRFLPNPHWVDELRPYDGREQPVRDYVLGRDGATEFLERFRALLDTVVPGYVQEGKRYLTIAVGCTGGRHRSVAIADEIGRYLADTTRLPVKVDHRDTGRA
jgi:UPF0042 nucleotide-binding protein